ncbi:MAG: hypothetical protein WBL68_01810 [Nitrososphaeraceae archaeon]
MCDTLSENQLYRCLADEKSLQIFRYISMGTPFTISSVKLTRKQYYCRLNAIAAVYCRLNGRYIPTSLGKVVNGFIDYLTESLCKEYRRYAAIDVLPSSLPTEEYSNIISTLLTDNGAKKVLLKG